MSSYCLYLANDSEPQEQDFAPSIPKVHALMRWPDTKYLTLPIIIAFLFAGVSFFPDMSVSYRLLVQGEYWRLGSAIFAHSSLSHWGLNSLAFVFWGYILQGHYGKWAFPILPLVAGIVSNALTVMCYDSNVRLLGASGVVFAMYGLWLVFFISNFTVLSLKKRLIRASVFGLLMLAPGEAAENVSHLAHFFGFASGLALGFMYQKINGLFVFQKQKLLQ